jgi:hypothetical protein
LAAVAVDESGACRSTRQDCEQHSVLHGLLKWVYCVAGSAPGWRAVPKALGQPNINEIIVFRSFKAA